MTKEITNIESQEAEEKRLINNKFRQIMHHSKVDDPIKRKQIKKAFVFANQAHKGIRRKSGELYIFHPLEVALICTRDIGLKTTSIICALIHDVVEDTDYTLKDIEVMFGKKVAKIVDGLTKISTIFAQSESLQAENFKKILLTLADDVRVIIIKLADRLHNMRTLESMPKEKQMKISSETSILYAPIANRLGLFAIKSELEDLVLKYKNPDAYRIISNKLKLNEIDIKKSINKFIQPIKKQLDKNGLEYRIIHRNKSISSIWNKMQTKKINFEQVYDIFAVRIILNSDIENEKLDCWKVYAGITQIYVPKQDRFRDWISVPKANGYEALHTTVMSKSGRWIEVQIRSKRMDEVAEKGYAAHWKYKDKTDTIGGLDVWLSKIQETLQNPDSDALAFLDEFKLNLFSDEIYVFTPKGDIRNMPMGSTVIDFAYSIHSKIGDTAIGAKINNQLVPLNHKLKSGDQIEIITSRKQIPKEDWMDWAFTARAKSNIKNSLNANRRKYIQKGELILSIFCEKEELQCNKRLEKSLLNYLGLSDISILHNRLGKGQLTEEDIAKFIQYNKDQNKWIKYLNPFSKKAQPNKKEDLANIIQQKLKKKPNGLLLSKKYDHSEIELAKCCQPIPGDDVIGFIEKNNSISIHRTTCSVASDLMSKYGNNIIKAKWREKGDLQFLTGIKLYGSDRLGLINDVSGIISSELGINIRSFSVETNNDLFEGRAMIYVKDSEQLNTIIKKLQKVEGVEKIYRIE